MSRCQGQGQGQSRGEVGAGANERSRSRAPGPGRAGSRWISLNIVGSRWSLLDLTGSHLLEQPALAREEAGHAVGSGEVVVLDASEGEGEIGVGPPVGCGTRVLGAAAVWCVVWGVVDACTAADTCTLTHLASSAARSGTRSRDTEPSHTDQALAAASCSSSPSSPRNRRPYAWRREAAGWPNGTATQMAQGCRLDA